MRTRDARVGDVVEIPRRKGLWVVERAEYEGGCERGGMSGYDSYPDALHVTARRLVRGKYSEKQRTITFTMNTTCYTDCIDGITFVGKMKRTFVWAQVPQKTAERLLFGKGK